MVHIQLTKPMLEALRATDFADCKELETAIHSQIRPCWLYLKLADARILRESLPRISALIRPATRRALNSRISFLDGLIEAEERYEALRKSRDGSQVWGEAAKQYLYEFITERLVESLDDLAQWGKYNEKVDKALPALLAASERFDNDVQKFLEAIQ